MNRREFLLSGITVGTGLLLPSSAIANHGILGAKAHVIIIGGGFAGYTAANYLLQWSSKIRVTLIEPQSSVVSCPMSNLEFSINPQAVTIIQRPHHLLKKKFGNERFQYIQGLVTGLNVDLKSVLVQSNSNSSLNSTFLYDELIIATGVEFSDIGLEKKVSTIDLYKKHEIIHAWKGNKNHTAILLQQLKSMKKGGLFAITIPKAPYKCPPAPYERACLIAQYLEKYNPTSTIHVYDANSEIISKKLLFQDAFSKYKNLTYYPSHVINTLTRSSTKNAIYFEYGEKIVADVYNIIPAQSASIPFAPYLKNKNKSWIGVNWWDCQTEASRFIYGAGDITFSAEKMPKSAQMATQHAKRIAFVLASKYNEDKPDTDLIEPIYKNICYSYMSHNLAAHITSHHHWNALAKTVIPEYIGLSEQPSFLETTQAQLWAQGIWGDSFYKDIDKNL